MRLLWKQRVIVAYLHKYPSKPVTRWKFRLHLVFTKRALMPAYYYIGFILPIFNEKISRRYMDYLDFIVIEAMKNGFIQLGGPSSNFSMERTLSVTHEGKKFLTYEGFTDFLIEKKAKKINIYLAIWGAIGGVAILAILFGYYTDLINWLTTRNIPF